MAMRLKELWDRYHFDDVNFQDETFFTKAIECRRSPIASSSPG